MKVEPAHPLLVSAVVGTCAPLVHRLTNNKFHKVKIFTPCYNYASSFDEKFRNKAMIEVKLLEFYEINLSRSCHNYFLKAILPQGITVVSEPILIL